MQGDVITKELQDAIRHIKTRADAWAVKEIEDALKQEPCDEIVHVETLHQVMWERDIAIGQLKELGYEFGQKIEPCNDAIRRADLGLTDFEIVMCNGDYKQALEMLIDKIQKAPPVTPSRRKGHWIKTNSGYECSECALESRSKSDFCQYCGTEMVEPQESEDKE